MSLLFALLVIILSLLKKSEYYLIAAVEILTWIEWCVMWAVASFIIVPCRLKCRHCLEAFPPILLLCVFLLQTNWKKKREKLKKSSICRFVRLLRRWAMGAFQFVSSKLDTAKQKKTHGHLSIWRLWRLPCNHHHCWTEWFNLDVPRCTFHF